MLGRGTGCPDGDHARHRYRATARTTVVPAGAKVQKLAGGFEFTEGPGRRRRGQRLLHRPAQRPHPEVEHRRQALHLHAAVRPLQRPVLRRQGQPLGLRRREERAVAHRPDGQGRPSSSRTTRASCSTAPTTSGCGPTAALYFTDPFYKRHYWKRGPKEQDRKRVYYLAPDHKTLTRVDRRPEAAQRHHRHAGRQDALRGRHRRRARPTPTTSSPTAR